MRRTPQEGARAIADLLFGRASPSGRLPATWYSQAYADDVSVTNMAMRPDAAGGHPGRTYRFLRDEGGRYVQYPFGHGLSYTNFT
jgi:xylan 1,4-beta-xylosidase